ALTISSTQGLRLTFDSIVKQAAMRLKVDAADVLVVEESTNDLQVAVSTGFRSPTIPNYRFPVPPEISATYPGGARFEVPAEMDWIGQYRRRSLFAREGFQAYRLAPLVMQNRFVGAMEVFHRSPLVPDREWIGFFEALASHAAIAVDNATDRARLQAGARETAIKSTAPVPELTLKDRQILGLIIDGATNQEIADRLHISHNTVKFHVRRLLGKAGAANRTDLAARVTRLGWLAPGLT
ncbi:MAG: LuxR C-terminal-related transcriptional regulator, partial [Candidatus Dormibacteraceae bacterium]